MYIDIDDMYYIHSYSAVWIKFNLNYLFLNILKTSLKKLLLVKFQKKI